MKKLYICNVENPTDHCRDHCPCGKPHRPEDCTKTTYCGIVDTETACRPLTEKENMLNILQRRQHYIRASTMNYQKCKQEKV